MPVLMTPVYAAGGYDLVVYALLLLAAIAMTVRVAAGVGGDRLGLGGDVCLGRARARSALDLQHVRRLPGGARRLRGARSPSRGRPAGTRSATRIDHPLDVPVWRWWATGVAIGCLPWFSTKYLVMAAVLGLVSLLRAWLPWPVDTATRGRAMVRTLAVSRPT